jgi:hypothetical protein
MIETFNDLSEAILFMENLAYDAVNVDYFKSELLRLQDGRWRVGVYTEAQMELPYDGFNV